MRRIFAFILVFLLMATNAQAALFDDAVGTWKLTDGTYTDTSGNGNDLTASVSAPAQAAGLRHGSTNTGLDFEKDSTQYLSIADASQTGLDLPSTGFTIAATIKPETASGATFAIVGKSAGVPNLSYQFFITTAGKLAGYISNNGTDYIQATAGTTLQAGSTYQVMMVYDAVNISLYVNNVIDTAANNPKACTTAVYDNALAFHIGSQSTPTNYFDGVIDDVVIWSRALTEAERLEFAGLDDDFGTSRLPATTSITSIGRWQRMVLNGRMTDVSITGGARKRFQFTGTSLAVEFDLTGQTYEPDFDYSIDGGDYTRDTADSVSITIATGLDEGTHTCDLWVAGVAGGQNRWTEFNGLRLRGLAVDVGDTVSAWALPQTGKIAFFGDSVGAGSRMLGDTTTPADKSARLSFPALVAEELDMELWLIAYESSGHTVTVVADGPLPETYNNYPYTMNGYAKDDPEFQIVVVEAVNNDSEGATLVTNYGALLDLIIADHPNARLFCMGRIPATPSDSASVLEVAQAKGCVYISPVGWEYTAPYTGHADQSGHEALADYVYQTIAPYWATPVYGKGLLKAGPGLSTVTTP